MARKEIEYTVKDEGRDKGKRFQIREMSANAAAQFALKTFSRAVRAGIEVPRDAENKGMMALAQQGYMMLVAMPYELSGELLDELMGCVQIIESSTVTRKLIDVDIEEVITILKLQKASYDLHVSFFPIGDQLTSGFAQQANEEVTLSIGQRRSPLPR